jgi:hypothetical protein
MPRVCPKCGSERVHRSHRRGAGERVLGLIGLKSRRCHECNTRFVAIGNSILFRSDVERLFRRVSLVVLAGVAVLLVVIVVLWFSRREESPQAALHRDNPNLVLKISRGSADLYVNVLGSKTVKAGITKRT